MYQPGLPQDKENGVFPIVLSQPLSDYVNGQVDVNISVPGSAFARALLHPKQLANNNIFLTSII